MDLTVWLPALVTIGAATIGAFATIRAAAVARRASGDATKIATEGAEKAMEVTKAQRADQLTQQIFAAKLEAYRRLSDQVGTTTHLAVLELRGLKTSPPPKEQESWIPLLNATNELAKLRVSEGYLYARAVLGAASELSEPLMSVLKLPHEKLDITTYSDLSSAVGLASLKIANAIREDLKLPAIEKLTWNAIDLGFSFYFEEDQENRRAS